MDYKQELKDYQNTIRYKLADIQKRMTVLNNDILKLSIYVQSGIFDNCIEELEQQ